MPITIEETIPNGVGGIDDPNAKHKQGDGYGVRRHLVVSVGYGFGGLLAAKALQRADVEVTGIDRTNHHLFQPLLYQVAAGILSEGGIAPPIRDILLRQRNTSVVLGEVVDVDIDARRLVVDPIGHRSEIAYDSLIIATGASQSYFGHPEFAKDAPAMKTIDDALELRGRIFGAFEIAEREPDPATRRRWLTFVVVGAGPTVFVIGDLMSLGNLPGLAQVAIQSGRHAAESIARRIAGNTTPRPFRYRDCGALATISRLRAIAAIGPLRGSGFLAWLLWLVIHLGALTGFNNRVSVLLNWTIAFLGHARAQRVITAQQIFARQALEKQVVMTSAAMHH